MTHATDPALLRRYDIPAPRYTSYPPVPSWSSTFGARDTAVALDAAASSAEPLSLYVHVPFCRKMCSYCGCNVVVARDGRVADDYLDHVALELELVAARLPGRRTVAQLHWGGGTPTFLSEAQLSRLWGLLTRHFTVAPDAEVAIEIDPRVTTRGQLTLLRRLGFNRLSLGVQDLAPAVQAAIGREQTLEQTAAAVDASRALSYAGLNMDLVYGLPGQTRVSWAATIDAVVRFCPDRVALYSFAHVPALRPHQRRLPVADLPTGAAKLGLFHQAADALDAAGYRPIGMDHFALASDPLAAAASAGVLHRNFQGYTVQASSTVLGIGVSAISHLDAAYAQNASTLPRYYAPLRAGTLPTVRGHRLTDDDRRRRALINALMCHLEAPLGADFAAEREALRPHARDGLVTLTPDAVRVTPLGRHFLRAIALVLDAHSRPQEDRASRAI